MHTTLKQQLNTVAMLALAVVVLFAQVSVTSASTAAFESALIGETFQVIDFSNEIDSQDDETITLYRSAVKSASNGSLFNNPLCFSPSSNCQLPAARAPPQHLNS